MKIFHIIVSFCAIISLSSCATPQSGTNEQTYESTQTVTASVPMPLPKVVNVPSDGASPQSGMKTVEHPSKTFTFGKIGQREFVKTGETVNLIYDGVDLENTFLKYESGDDGYYLELALLNEPVNVSFKTLCQTFIVASPESTTIKIDPALKFEQIVWTPRNDGTWEVRIGATERGCKSDALERLNKLRSSDYEKNLPKSTKEKKR